MLSIIALSVVLLSGCGQPEPIQEPEGHLVDVQELDLSFRFHEPLTLRASTDEAILSGETTAIQVQTLPYRDAVPAADEGEAPTWALPRSIAQSVFDERSCGPLKSERAYLPIDTTAPLRCDLVIDPSGRAVVWMVGIGRPFQDVPFLQSVLLVLEDERFHVLSYIHAFPEADATVQWLAETFPDRHPNMSSLIWPNRSFLLHAGEVREALSHHVDPPSAEVQDVMAALEELAFSVDRSRERPSE